jgi:predicted MFS family arabinose efflux permease
LARPRPRRNCAIARLPNPRCGVLDRARDTPPLCTLIISELTHSAEDKPAPHAHKGTIRFMAIAVAMIVANIYYIQPLLADIAREFRLTAAGAGTVAMLSQLGTACGMMVLVPLGDIRERRSLIALLVGLLALALAGFAAAPSLLWLCVAAAAVGTSGCAVHLIIPFAAHIAPPQARGRVIGTVVGGLLMGILLARTLSGYVGAQWGWRTMYWIAAVMMAFLCVLIRFYLPKSEPDLRFTYTALLRSIWGLVRDQPALREAAFTGSMMFLAFSAFWTTLTFRLEAPPYHYGSTVAGLFGLVGAAGAAAAPLIGRLADRFGPRAAIGWALGVHRLLYYSGCGGVNAHGPRRRRHLDGPLRAGRTRLQSNPHLCDRPGRARAPERGLHDLVFRGGIERILPGRLVLEVWALARRVRLRRMRDGGGSRGPPARGTRAEARLKALRAASSFWGPAGRVSQQA